MMATLCLALAAQISVAPLTPQAPPTPVAAAPRIVVAELGYLPSAEKVAILREAVQGYDAPDAWTPGGPLRVVRIADGSVALTVTPQPWGGGATHAISGDRVWWADFSALTESGTFVLSDPAAGESSAPFRIGTGVYAGALREAQRMFFYQRCGCAKTRPFADARWTDGACHLAPGQDTDCRFVHDTSPATSRDLSGGWHDAGDFNKYINFADGAVHDLLTAWEHAPGAFGDDFGLPESGNGLPDVLDEVRHELTWMLRMQNPDGSVLHKVSVTDFSTGSPPTADSAPRRYGAASGSATISACGAFAHGAVVFGSLADPGAQAFAAQLGSAATSAWSWVSQNPAAYAAPFDNTGFSNADAVDSPYVKLSKRLQAAAWLLRLTGNGSYRNWYDANYQSLHLFQWGWGSPFEHSAQSALLAYYGAPGATPAVRTAIANQWTTILSGADHRGASLAGTDAYRAYLPNQDHTWGSNRDKARQGSMLLSVPESGMDSAASWRRAAWGYLHYLHGVNPLGLTYLTNLRGLGIQRSCQEMYHGWFADGTLWDSANLEIGPAPGYLVGGPNPGYAPDPAYSGPPIVPPTGQPALKSYLDFNDDWPEASWQISEPQLEYQASYVRLLAELMP